MPIDPVPPQLTGVKRALPWLWALTLVVLVLASAAIGYRLTGPRFDHEDQVGPANVGPEPVTVGRDYYIYVKLVELRPTKEKKQPWDRFTGSAPDPYYRMTWQGSQVYRSPTRSDSFIAVWDLLGLDIRQVLLQNGGHVDVEAVVSAPVLRVEEGGMALVEVFEADALRDESAGVVDLALDRLHVGDNVMIFTAAQQPRLARMVVGVLDRATPLPQLLEAVSRR